MKWTVAINPGTEDEYVLENCFNTRFAALCFMSNMDEDVEAEVIRDYKNE